MENNEMSKFEEQIAKMTIYYDRIKELRECQKDDGIMIRIFLREIMPMYARLRSDIEEDDVLVTSTKAKLLEIVDWESSRAEGRDNEIEKFEQQHKRVFEGEYSEELAPNAKLESLFAAISQYYNQIKSLRARQVDDGIMVRIYLNEILPMYNRLRKAIEDDPRFPDKFKVEMLSLVDSEIERAPLREAEIEEAERAVQKEYAEAYNAAMARYQGLSPLLKLKYAKQFNQLSDKHSGMTIDELNNLFVEPVKDPKKPEDEEGHGEHE